MFKAAALFLCVVIFLLSAAATVRGIVAPHHWWAQSTPVSTRMIRPSTFMCRMWTVGVGPGWAEAGTINTLRRYDPSAGGPDADLNYFRRVWPKKDLRQPFIRTPVEQGVILHVPGFSYLDFTPLDVAWTPDAATRVVPVSVIGLTVPSWLGLLAALPVSAPILSRWRRAKRRRAGCCVRCGYDLRGSASGVCPECGVAAG